MRVAVLVKQIPKGEEMTLVDGRLNRAGVALEVNAYCRRANARAVELAGTDGEVVVFTMGPPSADDALREMIACGATRGVHLCDVAFAGSDTLATAKALALAIVTDGPFDLVLCGLNSLDADTGQVGPELAELLGFPFVAAARELSVDGGVATVRSETDHGYESLRVTLPAVISAAERLCDPSKAKPEACARVDAARITRRTATDLGLRLDEVGAAGSPTWVGVPRVLTTNRAARTTTSPDEAVAWLADLGALGETGDVPATAAAVPESRGGPPAVWVVLDPDLPRDDRELLGEAAVIANRIGASVVALAAGPVASDLSEQGADHVLVLPGTRADEWADAVATAAGVRRPRVILLEGTHAGREIASAVAARHGWGLTGDGIEIETDSTGALTVWKPALGGRLVVPIVSSSPVQVATIRPGVLAMRARRAARPIGVEELPAGKGRTRGRITRLGFERVGDGRAELAGATTVIGVGQGVAPDEYAALEPLRAVLGAQLAATRKVTDQGWMPRSRQIGITGLSITPRLFVSIGASGRFNHVSGFQASGVVLAINNDAEAEVFQHADVGLVGDWHEAVAGLTAALASRTAGAHLSGANS